MNTYLSAGVLLGAVSLALFVVAILGFAWSARALGAFDPFGASYRQYQKTSPMLIPWKFAGRGN